MPGIQNAKLESINIWLREGTKAGPKMKIKPLPKAEKGEGALAKWFSWLEHHPALQKVVGSTPTCLGHSPGFVCPAGACMGGTQSTFLTSMFLFSLSPPPSQKSINMSLGEDFLKSCWCGERRRLLPGLTPCAPETTAVPLLASPARRGDSNWASATCNQKGPNILTPTQALHGGSK